MGLIGRWGRRPRDNRQALDGDGFMSEESKPESKPKRRRKRLRLCLLFVLLAVTILICWSVIRVRQNRLEWEAKLIVWRMGGLTADEGGGEYYAPVTLSETAWVSIATGHDWLDDLFSEPPVNYVLFDGRHPNLLEDNLEELIVALQRMPQLSAVVFLEGAEISDESVGKLRQALPNCQVLVDVQIENG